LEANLALKNGAVIPYYFSAARVSFEGEDYLIGNGIDISARKEAEKALRDSEEKFSRAFRNSPVILSISTLQEGRYLEVNNTFERITGWRA
jgi:PAS domain-containing protein